MPATAKPQTPVFYVYGPHDLPITLKRQLDKKELRKKFHAEELADDVGCYVISTRGGNGIKPLYVGKTSNQALLTRIIQHESTINRLLKKIKRPLCVWFLIYDQNRKTNIAAIDALETELIQMALKKNPELLNIQKTVQLKVRISGVLNTRGRKTEAATNFRKAMGIGT